MVRAFDCLWVVLLLCLRLQFVKPFFNQLKPNEKIHLFGQNSEEPPQFSTLQGSPLIHNTLLNITINNKLYSFLMKDHSTNLFDIGFHQNFHSPNRSHWMAEAQQTHLDCNQVFKGHSIKPRGAILSMSGCKDNLRGLIILPNGEYHFVHPVPSLMDEGVHVIHKRELKETKKSCGFRKEDDPFPGDQVEADLLVSKMLPRQKVEGSISQKVKRSILHDKDEELIVELAVFADHLMVTHFREIYGELRHMREMKRFIVATINNVDTLYKHQTLNSRLHFRVKRIDIMEQQPDVLLGPAHHQGEVNALLKAFCQYQKQLKPADGKDPKNWVHALLLTGFDLYAGSLKSIAGFSAVKGMCSEERSCTINEGLDFGSVFVVTHEIGHNLGMYHDGQNNRCEQDAFIMSPSIGAGKTHWSACSSTEMGVFVSKLGTEDDRAPNCLNTSPIKSKSSVDLPGQQYTVHEQCRLFHGLCWEHELRSYQTLEDICEIVWCSDTKGKLRTAHPSLEGTHCGSNKVCFGGKCVPSTIRLIPVHGGWSKWSEASFCEPESTGKCSECQIKGQIKLKQEHRYCDSPFPNNDGNKCSGENVRGSLCSSRRCNGPFSLQQYINSVCGQKAKLPENIKLNMDSTGTQYDQDMCKVWCFMKESTSIRTVEDLPDGSPCGENKYCVKGLCKRLACNGNKVSDTDNECQMKAIEDDENKAELGTKRRSQAEWARWGGWSECVGGVKCDGIGFKSRFRSCNGIGCPGNDSERMVCRKECAKGDSIVAGKWEEWKPFSNCTTNACNQIGSKTRFRTCNGGNCVGSNVETISCKKECPPGKWEEWKPFGNCTANGCSQNGTQTRFRTCITSNCVGSNSETISCKKECPPGQWEEWKPFGNCTANVCNQFGTQTRFRTCKGENCIGSNSDTVSCQKACIISKWKNWESWGACSTSECNASGIQTRIRVCDGLNCDGSSIDKIVCKIKCVSKVVVGDEWQNWGGWNSCVSESCMLPGVQNRTRQCNGKTCNGVFIEKMPCHLPCTVDDGKWTLWSHWSPTCHTSSACHATGTRTRTRRCWSFKQLEPVCEGQREETENCPVKEECLKR
uniref:Peptidase M12B domain-containing protein n=1 Tax=Rhabditophanes sp. KR3021 TaxID=114890 RepID=A0AC35U946_9BILA